MTSVLCLSSKYLLIDLVIHIDTCTSIVNILKIYIVIMVQARKQLWLYMYPNPFLATSLA